MNPTTRTTPEDFDGRVEGGGVPKVAGEPGPSRRIVLCRALALAAGGLALAACGGDGDGGGGGDASTGGQGAAGGPAQGTPGGGPAPAEGAGGGAAGGGAAGGKALGAASEIPVGGGRVYTAERVVVTQPTAGEFRAFTAVCPHQRLLVGTVSGGEIRCPHHGSRFSASDGAVKGGPATSGLAPVGIQVTDGRVTLTG